VVLGQCLYDEEVSPVQYDVQGVGSARQSAHRGGLQQPIHHPRAEVLPAVLDVGNQLDGQAGFVRQLRAGPTGRLSKLLDEPT
jgi:hypothetical protein